MSTSSVDGLVSGMQTSSMIAQLMQVEAAPQTKLKTKVQTAQTAVASYQSVNAKLAATKSAAGDVVSLASWRSLNATSTSQTVTAKATGGLAGMAGSINFDVSSVARAQTSTLNVDTTSTGFPSSFQVETGTWSTDSNGADVFTGSGSFTTVNVGKPYDADAVTTAVNDAGLGIRAYTVKTGDTAGVMQFVQNKSGAANGFRITGLTGSDGNPPADTSARDATLTLNPGTSTEYKVSSSTNTFSTLMPGVSITASKVEQNVTVGATTDVNAIAGKFQAMVDAANAALGEIKDQTKYDASTKSSSPLTGDFTVRQMTQQTLSLVSNGLTYDKTTKNPDGTTSTAAVGFGSLSQFGIGLDSTGQLTFDAAAFTKAYNEDPAKVQEAGTAFAKQVKDLATTQTNTVTKVVQGRNNEIDALNDQIENWDVRLATRKEALQKQYAGLEAALGKLKDQGTWLSGQLAGLH
ncbi:flagellar hook protein [Actinoplanes sp. SE50]|uniref:flagellar filament capping protein FliD n=1 Tax=unclassified Actinoplanes TaxID=2626549 RepID=UPI00023EDEE3|nr:MULTISPECIES: flagellar filament capping protein FliD [unclassified Actinoplanes]AEV88778.1 Flagellar hook-associated protein 2 [Actinoplanes sp. SE50/110]ATO87184.1 flagellar hook protein [Actinoplanes sp. SE50]SLM04602.1 Flagellar hook-associated protein 2 [Actinoplanes sp. SE50/110]